MLQKTLRFLINKSSLFKDELNQAKLKTLLKEFLKQKKIYRSFYKGNEDKLDLYFITSILLLFSYFSFDRIKFSLTDSKSIFYRLFINDFEINLEVFYTKDYESDEIEAVYSIYYDGQIILQESSKLEAAIQSIRVCINRHNQQLSSNLSVNHFNKSSFYNNRISRLSQTSTI